MPEVGATSSSGADHSGSVRRTNAGHDHAGCGARGEDPPLMPSDDEEDENPNCDDDDQANCWILVPVTADSVPRLVARAGNRDRIRSRGAVAKPGRASRQTVPDRERRPQTFPRAPRSSASAPRRSGPVTTTTRLPVCRPSGSHREASASGGFGRSWPSPRLLARPAKTLPRASGAAGRSRSRRRPRAGLCIGRAAEAAHAQVRASLSDTERETRRAAYFVPGDSNPRRGHPGRIARR